MASPRLPEASEDSTSVSRSRPMSAQQTTTSRVQFPVSKPELTHRSASLISTSSQGSRKILFADNVHQPKQRAFTSVVRARVGTSPPPVRRFSDHVSFDNFSKDEPTEKNTISYTLNSKHRGYKYKRRSRTFMVGLDENDYSDNALQWLLEELVDDGDEIIVLRVVDKDSKISNDRGLEKKTYQEEARQIMDAIKSKNDENRAIRITLEFAVGKLHQTFNQFFQLYEPAMLIVGTRGRSLGGFQGLVGRNSFSKWCLQYSPIPVIIVRPDEKREKKKLKRSNDPSRQSYIKILQESGRGHEANSNAEDSIYGTTMLTSKDADGEAHEVALALELPAHFDPTIKHHQPEGLLALRRRSLPSVSPTDDSPQSQPTSPTDIISPDSEQADSPEASEAEDSEDDEEGEGEFETFSGHRLLGNKESGDGDESEDDEERGHVFDSLDQRLQSGDGKEGKEETPEEKLKKEQAKEKMDKLHAMEQGEAKALALGRRRLSIDSQDSQEGDGEGAASEPGKDG